MLLFAKFEIMTMPLVICEKCKLYTGNQYICSGCFLLSYSQLVSSTSIFLDIEYSLDIYTCFLKQNALLVKCVETTCGKLFLYSFC